MTDNPTNNQADGLEDGPTPHPGLLAAYDILRVASRSVPCNSKLAPMLASLLGRFSLELGGLQQAEDDLATAIDLRKQHGLPTVFCDEVLLANTQALKASADGTLDPDAAQASREMHSKLLLETARETLEPEPSFYLAGVCSLQGACAMYEGDWVAAEGHLLRAMEIKTALGLENLTASDHGYLAKVYEKLGRPDEANEHRRKLLRQMEGFMGPVAANSLRGVLGEN